MDADLLMVFKFSAITHHHMHRAQESFMRDIENLDISDSADHKAGARKQSSHPNLHRTKHLAHTSSSKPGLR